MTDEHTLAEPKSKVTPQTNVPTTYQLPTPYGCKDMAGQDIVGQSHYGRTKGQMKVTP